MTTKPNFSIRAEWLLFNLSFGLFTLANVKPLIGYGRGPGANADTDNAQGSSSKAIAFTIRPDSKCVDSRRLSVRSAAPSSQGLRRSRRLQAEQVKPADRPLRVGVSVNQ